MKPEDNANNAGNGNITNNAGNGNIANNAGNGIIGNNVENDGHKLHLPHTCDFEADNDYDYLRQGPVKTASYYFTRAVAHVFLRLYNKTVFGLKIKGIKNLRGCNTGAVIMCNHVHPMDCTFIDCLFPFDRVYYATLESNFQIPIARHLIRAFGGLPVPGEASRLRYFLKAAREALKNGAKICIYPEGILDPYYAGLRDFKDGAFRIAASCSVPIIPLVITFREPKGLYKCFKTRPCATLTVLPPIIPPEKVTRGTAEELKHICEESMRSVV